MAEASRAGVQSVRTEHEHHDHGLPPLADPGKEERSARGLPVVPEFDGYRAFGIFAILATHLILAAAVVQGANGDWGDRLMAGFGAWLITILFVVSGFVVFLPTVARGGDFGSIGAYAVRRAARLLPGFWLAMAIVLILLAASGAALPSVGELIVTFAGQDTWARLFDHTFPMGFGINGPVWSLTLEISFYILLPLIASAYYRRPLVGLALAAAISIGWRLGFAHVSGIAGLFGVDVDSGRAGELQLRFLRSAPELGVRVRRRHDGRLGLCESPAPLRGGEACRAGPMGAVGRDWGAGDLRVLLRPVRHRRDAGRGRLRGAAQSPLFIAYVGAIAAAMLARACPDGGRRLRHPRPASSATSPMAFT